MLTDPKLRSQVDALWDTPSRRFYGNPRRPMRRFVYHGANCLDDKPSGRFAGATPNDQITKATERMAGWQASNR